MKFTNYMMAMMMMQMMSASGSSHL